jgi:rhodanese-related sulfurtransferase
MKDGAVSATLEIHRIGPRDQAMMVPRPAPDVPGLFLVDSTWGAISPMRLAAGVPTLGELEVIEHIKQDRPLVDTRSESFYRDGSIPGARSIPHDTMSEAIGTLDCAGPTVFFCNGPQCKATPSSIRTLLRAGYPAQAILYYRGGVHDWVTLGLPLLTPA